MAMLFLVVVNSLLLLVQAFIPHRYTISTVTVSTITVNTIPFVTNTNDLSQLHRCNRCHSRRVASSLLAKRPKLEFNEEEKEELRRILDGEYWDDIDFSSNLSPKPNSENSNSANSNSASSANSNSANSNSARQAKPQVKKPLTNSYEQSEISYNGNSNQARPKRSTINPTGIVADTVTASVPKPKPVMEPNANWRTALRDPVKPKLSNSAQVQRKPGQNLDDLELDYDDFELAMMEEDYGGMNPTTTVTGKRSAAPTERYGLISGEKIRLSVLETLLDSEGKPFSLEKLVSVDTTKDVLVLYADPRRMNDDFKLIMNQFSKIPASKLRAHLAVVNCDDVNDHRKFVKKNALVFPLLSDSSRKVMDALKCRISNKIASGLVMLDINTGKVLKAWYQGEWDVITTKDLITEEVSNYRNNPGSFMQSQIGLR